MRTQADAMTGSFRPFFGAMLARPADHWSALRGTLLDRYPYALPSLVVGLIPVLSVLPGLAVIQETLPKNKRRTWWSAYSSVKRKMSLTRERPRIAGPLFIWPVTYAFILWALAVVSSAASAAFYAVSPLITTYEPVHDQRSDNHRDHGLLHST